jgi:hypothetical protein
MKIRYSIFLALLLGLAASHLCAETWYVRADGGTRNSQQPHHDECDGKADAPYPGTGINRHCAFNDIRFLWDSGAYGNYSWIISGGDTVVVEGCAATHQQVHSDAPHCRIGWDENTGRKQAVAWCAGSQANFGCSMPPPPNGSPGHPTRILGKCVLTGTCHSGNATVRKNLTQLFGGFGLGSVLDLSGARYLDIEGLEITEHNGRCVKYGSPADPRGCITFPDPNADDYADHGILTNASTSNITLQDLYIHGFTASGLQGPIGGPVTMTRVFIGFNAFSGWNFDDGKSTPDAPGSSIAASYVTMEGNGCNEEYPILHKNFPALSCYDSDSGGFGDSWSGQNTKLRSFTCDHCVMAYNTKDGFIGPHTAIADLRITNSESYGNMGQQWKWGTDPNSTTVFENNLTTGNCRRMSAPLLGAAAGYNRHLSLFCRAAGDIFAFYTAPNSKILFADNTIIGYSSTTFDLSCQTPKACGSAQMIFRNNIVLGFLNPSYRPGDTNVPGLFYYSDPSVKLSMDHDLFANLRSRPCPFFGTSDLICSDPLFVHEPPLRISAESQLDNFNFHPSSGSPAVGHGQAIDGLLFDFYGVKRPNPPSIGAVEPQR